MKPATPRRRRTAPDHPPFRYEPSRKKPLGFTGSDAAIVAIGESFRRKGVQEVRWGWLTAAGPGEAPRRVTGKDFPADLAVIWWFEAVTPDGRTHYGEYGPTTDHARGILEAAAVILRSGEL